MSVEGALLPGRVLPGRADGGALQRAMHPLVGAVLLGPAGMNPLMLDPQPQPPDVEAREAM